MEEGRGREEEVQLLFFSSSPFPERKSRNFFFNLWFKFQTKFYYLYEHYGSFKKMCSKNQKLFIRVNDGGRILINSPCSNGKEGEGSLHRLATAIIQNF